MRITNFSAKDNAQSQSPGEGIRSLKSTNLFRVVNFELYAKPNNAIMILGVVAMGISVGYIAYMRRKYENMGYYSAVGSDDKDVFLKKDSKWNN